MADALVELLNERGYQPFSVSRTNVDPPDVFTVMNRDVQFWGRLHKFCGMREGDTIPKVSISAGRCEDFELRHTSKKSSSSAVSCLRTLLQCIGLSSVPKIDLSFCGKSRLTFSVAGVTFRRVDPVDLDAFFRRFSQRNIPNEYVEAGSLHVSYEYLYAERLRMQTDSSMQFDADVEGNIGSYLDLGANADVAVLGRTTVEFTSTNGDAAAFAFKSGRLLRTGSGWQYFIHESALSGSGAVGLRPWIPVRGELLGDQGGALCKK